MSDIKLLFRPLAIAVASNHPNATGPALVADWIWRRLCNITQTQAQARWGHHWLADLVIGT